MSTMRKMIAGSLLGILAAGMVYAEEPPMSAAGDYLFDTYSFIRLKSGDMTWSGAGSFTAQLGDNGDTAFDFRASVAYFVTDYIEVEGGLSFLSMGDANGVGVSVGVNRYFREWIEKLYPYIGAGFTAWLMDLQDSLGNRVELKAGVRHYLSPHLGLKYWAQFEANMEAFDEGALSGFVGIFSHPY